MHIFFYKYQWIQLKRRVIFLQLETVWLTISCIFRGSRAPVQLVQPLHFRHLSRLLRMTGSLRCDLGKVDSEMNQLYTRNTSIIHRLDRAKKCIKWKCTHSHTTRSDKNISCTFKCNLIRSMNIMQPTNQPT